MIKNFTLSSSITLKFEDQEPDLHNCFRVKMFTNCFENNTFKILFSKTYPPNTLPSLITIEFRNPRTLEASKNIFNLEEPYLEEMGYKNPGDIDIDWLIEEKKSTAEDHLILRFCGDEYIRIYCDHAIATAEQ